MKGKRWRDERKTEEGEDGKVEEKKWGRRGRGEGGEREERRGGRDSKEKIMA